jgi:hypothetical protein
LTKGEKRDKMQGMENIEKMIEKLPVGYEKAAGETGGFKQKREIKSVNDLLRLIFLYIVNGLSYIEISTIAKVKGIANISDVGFMKRFSKSGKLFKWMLENLKPQATAHYKKPEKMGEKAVKLLDASVVSTGGKVRTSYRLHYAIDIFEMKSEQYKITPYEVGESLTNFEIKAGDLYIGDRAYGTKTSMEHCLTGRGDFIFRIRKGAFDIYEMNDIRKIKLVDELKKLEESSTLDIDCRFINSRKEFVTVRICAMKKPKNTHETNGNDTKFMNNYIVVVTSLLEPIVSAKEILDMYRLRWQVELYFKRLKSLLGFGDMPNKTPGNIEIWLNAKLTAAILLEITTSEVDFSPSG